MYKAHNSSNRGSASSFRGCTLGLALALTVGSNGTQAVAGAQRAHCSALYDPTVDYPAVSRLSVAAVDGQAGVFSYLLDDFALIEHTDGCFYEVDEVVLEIDFGDLDEVVLFFELPEHAVGTMVFVTEDGNLLETLELQGGTFTYVLLDGEELGFEIAIPGSEAPTVPVVVTKPTTDDPEPV